MGLVACSRNRTKGGERPDGGAALLPQRWMKAVIEISAARNRPGKPFCCGSVDLAAFSIDRSDVDVYFVENRMFIFPYYLRLFLKFATCNGTTYDLGDFVPADFLGSRDDTDKESVRLHRALARTLSADGLKGIRTKTRLSREIQRYHESKSSDPNAYREIKASQMSSLSDISITNDVSILLSPPVLQSSSEERVSILEKIERAERLAVSSRSGKATSKDFAYYPWVGAGKPLIPVPNETEIERVERLVTSDVVLFLWVVALISSVGSLSRIDIENLVPARGDQLGGAWVTWLQAFTPQPKTAPKRGPKPMYQNVATFLVSGAPDGGPMQTVADELSALDRGKKRLTARVLGRHRTLLEAAFAAKFEAEEEHPNRATDLAGGVWCVGSVLGFLQFAKEVGLSELRDKYPSADLDRAFDDGLAFWSDLVRKARA